jgi:DNA-binding NtrC family response regulator
VRVISASNRVLEDEVEAGRFRRDLYFRLVTLRIELPPLRERASDLPMLVHHFIRDYVDRTGKPIAGIDATTLAALQSRDWPGNVRELQAEIERACVVTPANGAITSSCLAPWRHPPLPDAGPTFRVAERGASHATLPEILGQVERHLLAEALQDAKGNKTAAAKSLGISRQRYTKRLRRWGLEP